MAATESHVVGTYVSAVHRRLQMQQKSRRIQICLELCQSGKITSCIVEGKLISDKQTIVKLYHKNQMKLG